MIIGITGGIGAGKSVVSRILRLKGFEVYDCDSRASEIMHSSSEILIWLKENIGEEAVDHTGSINRKAVGEVIFSDFEKRESLNRIVHTAVYDDVKCCSGRCGGELFFVESAILATSHLDELCDRIWLVEAPVETRIMRVEKRSGLDRKNIEDRIKTQQHEFDELDKTKTSVIINDGSISLLEQIESLIENICPGDKLKSE